MSTNGAAAETTSQTPAYVAYPTFENFLGRLKEHAVPSHIDKSMMPSLSGAVQSHLLSALRFLGLVEGKNDQVTPELQELVEQYGTESFKPALKEVLAAAYGDIIGDLNIAQATVKQLDDAFAKQNLDGTMRERAIRFYLRGLTSAGVAVSPYLGNRKRKSPSAGRTKKSKSLTGNDSAPKAEHVQKRSTHDFPTGTQRYPLYFRDKPEGALVVPKDLSLSDCKVIELQLAVLKAYAESEGE
jgi:hypothetical protein